MEVMMPSPMAGAEFNFNSTCTSPIESFPSSPHGCPGNYFFSAPTSPTSASVFYRQISFAFTAGGSSSPDNSEELFTHSNNSEEDEADSTKDFAFEFSGQLESTPSLPADELFDGGKIKPLEPPPKKILRNALSFRKKKKYSDPCTEIIIKTRNDTNVFEGRDQRGRDIVHDSSSTARRQKGSQSLSPLPEPVLNHERSSKRRWKLTDLLLFRSASEGHATNKKYDFFRKSQPEDVKNSSFRSKDRSGSVSNGGRKKEMVSAHEQHYKVNRAAAGEMRRKTFLPYKQNLMGCMDLDAVNIREPSGRTRISNSQVMMRQY